MASNRLVHFKVWVCPIGPIDILLPDSVSLFMRLVVAIFSKAFGMLRMLYKAKILATFSFEDKHDVFTNIPVRNGARE